ncbi:MAG: indolepyruvate oxidoreductase subunit beta [Candidatus Thorarchaeota archaeon]
MSNVLNILVAGVGGQGNLICGRALAEAAVINGLRPVLGETFGASRRGGSVLTHLRISDRDLGPLIPKGHVDIIIGLEPIETLRSAVRFGSERTISITSTEPVQSLSTLSGEHTYPPVKKILDSLKDFSESVYALDSGKAMKELGSYRPLNIYILGAFAGLKQEFFDSKVIISGIEKVLEFDELNRKAFELGLRDIALVME